MAKLYLKVTPMCHENVVIITDNFIYAEPNTLTKSNKNFYLQSIKKKEKKN